MKKNELIYLASPYSHANYSVMSERFRAVCSAASRLMRDGYNIFSPIAHTHPIALAGGLPTDFDYWQKYDELILSRCDRLVVLMLDGWEESNGIAMEIEIAKRIGIPVEYINADTLEVKQVDD